MDSEIALIIIVLVQLFVKMSCLKLEYSSSRDVDGRAGCNETVVVHRIINESSVIHSPSGVSVDFGYNETKIASEEGDDDVIIPSSPGCPKSVGGLPWLYRGNPPSCYLVGTAGSCPPGQLLFGNGSSHFAHCDCMCSPRNNGKSKWWGDGYDVHVREFSRFLFCTVKDIPEMNGAVFDKESGTCHFLDTQGICQVGEWLVRDKEIPGNIKCVSQCSNETGPFESPFFYNWQEEKCELKSTILQIQPVSLAATVGQNGCEDGKVFSKTLQKCIPKSKAFIMKFRT